MKIDPSFIILNSKRNYGTLYKFISPLYLCGQHDFRILPRYVFIPCRIKECEDSFWGWVLP